uniref:DRBM domain-containing protein n=1 Tax=Romanomermis culicivorax TaxID=13658 RepID=A0A915K2Y4_ROMCU
MIQLIKTVEGQLVGGTSMSNQNVKLLLHSWCSMSRFPAPVYEITQLMSKSPLFQAEVRLEFMDQLFTGLGRGSSKSSAKTAAAENICQKLKDAGYDFLKPTKRKLVKVPVKVEMKEKSKNVIERANEETVSAFQDKTTFLNYCKRKLREYGEENGAGVRPGKRSKLEIIEDIPSSVLECKLDCLNGPRTFSLAAWSHYFRMKQKKLEFDLKLAFMSKLTDQVRRYIHPQACFYIFGSSISGLGSYDSDLDMCLSLPVPPHIQAIYRFYGSDSSPEILFDHDIRDFNVRILKHLRKMMYRFFQQNRKINYPNISVIPAKVPILKLENVKFGNLNLEVDINIDARFGALVLLVKRWAAKARIASPKEGTLSGLSLSLMVLHLLQQTLENQRPIMPDLQQLLPQIFNRNVPVGNLRVFAENILPHYLLNANFSLKYEPIIENFTKNDETLANLLLNFFEYYALQVDFGRYFISIRSGGSLLSRSLLNGSDGDQYIFVEEPFDGSNCARCVYNEFDFLRIKKAFREAYEALNKNLCLHSLGIDLSEYVDYM